MDQQKTLLVIVALIYTVFTYSQRQQIVMEYDNAGNRISRTVIQLRSQARSVINTESEEDEYSAESCGEYEIRVYPNPTKGALKVQLIGAVPQSGFVMRLFSNNGSLLLQKNNIESETTIEMFDFPNGIYILSILLNAERYEFKVIKE